MTQPTQIKHSNIQNAGLGVFANKNFSRGDFITNYKGRIIKTIGDSIMAVFDEPSIALDCTISLQRAIAAHDEVAPEILRFSVRMGLHYGRAVQSLFSNR